MTTSDRDRVEPSALERKARTVFADSVAATDAATRSRLTRARYRALAELASPPVRGARWLPAGAVAAALLVTLLLVRLPDRDTQLEMAAVTDLEIMLDADDLELIEDLEFYAWLDEQLESEAARSEANGVG